MLLFPVETLSRIQEILTSPKKILIISHHNPDGDALGSSLALNKHLSLLGHQTQCIYPSGYPEYYLWMPEIAKAIVYKESTKNMVQNWFETADIIFCLDFNATNRVNELSTYLVEAKGTKILIDHHEQPSDEFDIYLSFPGTSSTCELIFNYIVQMTSIEHVNLDIATCLYTGLITDTGGFQFSSTHSSTLKMASALMDLGLDTQPIFNHCFNNFSINRLNLFGHCIANNMIINETKGVAYMWIDHKTKIKFNIQDGDTEGLVNYPLKVETIKVALLFKEDRDKIRISLRSKNDNDVSHIARTYFHGGGHKNASGGMSKLNLKDTLHYFESLIPTLF